MDLTPLEGLDPYDLLDAEAARIDAHLGSLPDEGWGRPSRCAGWSVRDVAAHLAATEGYHHACLDGRVRAFADEVAARGAVGLGAMNDLGISDRAGRSNAEILAEWRAANADTRRRLRRRDGGDMDTSIGPYPVRLQAFHLAGELATHADDMGVPITEGEAEGRWGWRGRFSRFALSETKPSVAVTVVDGAVSVRVGEVDHVLSIPAFVEAVAGRDNERHPVEPALREALSIMP